MKYYLKYLSIIFLILSLGLCTSCSSQTHTYSIDGPHNLTVGVVSQYFLVDEENHSYETTFIINYNDLASLDNHSLTALKEGNVTLSTTYHNTLYSLEITITPKTITRQSIEIIGCPCHLIGEIYQYTFIDEDPALFTWSSSDNTILQSLGAGSFKALKEGTVTITCFNNLYEGTLNITITPNIVFNVEDDITLYINHFITLNISTNLKDAIVLLSQNTSIVSTNSTSLTLKGLAEGHTKVTLYCGSITKEIDVTVTPYTFDILVDDKTYTVTEGEKIDAVLKSIYNNINHEEKDLYNFIGWFSNSTCTQKIDTSKKVSEGLTLYSLYEPISIYNYSFSINQLLMENDLIDTHNDILVFTQDYGYIIKQPLKTYHTYTIQYDLSLNSYYVSSVNLTDNSKYSLKIPATGFIIAISSTHSNINTFDTYLTLHNKIGLDSYTINKSSTLTINPPKVKRAKSVSIDNSSIHCGYAALYDATTQQLLWSMNGTETAYPASMTKMMTAITALKYCDPDDTHTIGSELDLCFEGDNPSTAGLGKTQIWTLRDLLYGLMLPSGNDAAYGIAAMVVEKLRVDETWTMRQKIDYFQELVNETGEELGLVHSHFSVPDGNSYFHLDGSFDERTESNYTCSEDMAKIGAYVLKHSLLAKVVDSPSHVIYPNGVARTVNLTNTLTANNPTLYVGCKTGTTDLAMYCVTEARYYNNRLVIAVIMHDETSPGRYTDAETLFSAYDQVNN